MVVLTATHFHDDLSVSTRVAVVGPFRSKRKAEGRAKTLKRLANTYEDPEGITGPDNAIAVAVEPLVPGENRAQDALDTLYGSIDWSDLLPEVASA